jgi:hypothetical protein
MGLKIEYIDGQTPLDEEEKEGLLISTITTRGGLDEFEQQNILMADVIVNHIFGKPVFTWNRTNLNKKGMTRNNYLKAIREADLGNMKLLMEFAKA